MSKKDEDLSLGGFLALHEPYLCQLLDLFPILGPVINVTLEN